MKTLIQSLRIVLFMLIMLLIKSLSAQSIISGTLDDPDGNGLPFATVLVLDAQDSSMIQGTITNDEGQFELKIKPGTYLLEASSVGFRTRFLTLDENHTLGRITLEEDTQQLDEVVVTAKKPFFEKQADRMVVNVQSKVTSAGSTVLQVLERSPGVNVNRQNNSISLNGKRGVLVMIDGKMTRLPPDAIVQMLNGMSSANIEKIELITTPPASMDAEGDAGIINIVTIETADKGTNGTLGVSAGRNRAETLGGNFSLHHREDRLNYFINYSILSDDNGALWISEFRVPTTDFTKTSRSINHRDPVTTTQNLSAGLELDFSPKTTGKFLLTAFRRKWDTYDLLSSQIEEDPATTIHDEVDIREINIWQSLGGSIGLAHKLSDDSRISGEFDYLVYANEQPSNYAYARSVNQNEASETYLDASKDTPIVFRVGKIDYNNRLSDKVNLEAGSKVTNSTFENEVIVREDENGTWVDREEFTDQSMLEETILAGYTLINWVPSEKWAVSGGLRFEQTNTYLTSRKEGVVVDRQLNNFFPSGTVSRSLGENSKLQLAFNRRISRPSFRDLAPFIFFTGPNNYISGNANLRPAISNSSDIGYQFKQWYVSVNHSLTRNTIGRWQTEIDAESNTQIVRPQNLGFTRTWALNTGLSIGVTTWWEIQADISVFRQILQTKHYENNVSNRFNYIMPTTTWSFSLPKDFSVEVSANYTSTMQEGLWELGPLGMVNAGIKKQFNNGGALTFNATDIFHTYIWKYSSYDPDAGATSSGKYDLMLDGFTVTYSLTFGNRKLRSVNIASGSAAERSRVD